MQRPNISKETFEQYIKDAPANIAKAMERYIAAGRLSKEESDKYLLTAIKMPAQPVKVVAIRGYYKDSMGEAGKNDRGIFDDAFAVSGPGYFKTFNGNTDPRKFGAGIGMLLPGVHYFKKGLHGFAHGPYPAFRTANIKEILPVLRDGQFGIRDGVTINLHKGGVYNTNSIACQTVQAEEWLEFQKDVYKLMQDNSQRELPYILIENL